MKLGLYSGTLNGHRKSYLEFALKNFTSQRVNPYELFTSKDPVLFLMVEDSFLLYFLVSIFRSLVGRLTAGLLFRPIPVVENTSIRLKIKKFALFILKKMPKVKTLLIVPESTHPEFPSICDGWIYDFQFWDLQEKNYQTFQELRNREKIDPICATIDSARNNRKVLCALGGQDRIKGFDTFASTYINNKDMQKQFLFGFGGKVKGFNELAVSFEKQGGFSENRFVSDNDLTALYASSDLVWTLYAEDYDQASGIFGRAVQFGIPVVVRENSLIHKICILDSIAHIALNRNNVTSLSSSMIQVSNIEDGRKLHDKFKKISLENLTTVLELRAMDLNE